MDLDQVLNNPIAEFSGWTTTGTGVILSIGRAVGVEEINPWVAVCTGIAGFVFLIYKIINIRLANSNKKIERQILKKQLEELEKTIGDGNSH